MKGEMTMAIHVYLDGEFHNSVNTPQEVIEMNLGNVEIISSESNGEEHKLLLVTVSNEDHLTGIA
jgi:hypothetical protein